ncbi:MAG TPA: beta-ketoacyl-[acyl-carrier-protein] synthase family protein [Ilumatobacteraceae bacterium]|nr:beta-ketoacyl-[acyl-carrier-protein] synthase family protein [Ilumatobacteraceae bacterium]
MEGIVDLRRFGVVYGTGIGGLRTLEEQVEIRLAKGEKRVSPFLVPMMMGNASGAAISMRYGLQGPLETICTACAAATHAIGYAARLIAWGRCDAMVTGGSEAAATPTSIGGFNNMTALSTSGASKPFDVTRDGFVMGEGAATFILEEWSVAEARGATILGEVLGAASTADAHHITAPSPGGVGAIHCIELALADAGLQPGDIAHINAHGTSTPLNDAAEAQVIACASAPVGGLLADFAGWRVALMALAVFGAGTPPVTSTKGVTGHALGAAGALEAAAVLLAMQHRLIPPTAGTTELSPDMHIDLVMGAPRPWTPGPSISNNFGFGGHNGSVIIGPG